MTTTETHQQPEPDYGDDDELQPAADSMADLLGALPPAFPFPEIGDTCAGTVLDMVRGTQRDMEGNARTFDNGDERKQVIAWVQTDEHDDDDDDGVRRLFIKGAMTKAFRTAAREARVRVVQIGDQIRVTYTHDAEPKKAGLSGAKQFTVEIIRPL